MAKNKNQKTVVTPKKTGPKVSARPVSKLYKRLARHDRSEYSRLDSLFQSLRLRTRVIERPQNAQEKILKEKYLNTQEVETRAAHLLNQFGEAGLKRAEAIQAVKTDRVDLLTNKWTPRLTEFKRVQEAMKRGRMGELLKNESRL
jgi:hypothetical protein